MERVCVVCGEPMENRRRDALACSAACRRERSRLRAILSGQEPGPYGSVHDRLVAAENRANGATGAVFGLRG